MPIYEYQCKSCGHTLDALQKLAEEPLEDCPECGKPQLTKLLSTPAFHVRGKGGAVPATRTRIGHNLDGAASHSHDAGHSHSHTHGPHTHTHGGCGGGGCGHTH